VVNPAIVLEGLDIPARELNAEPTVEEALLAGTGADLAPGTARMDI
jgi:hypothetical protein